MSRDRPGEYLSGGDGYSYLTGSPKRVAPSNTLKERMQAFNSPQKETSDVSASLAEAANECLKLAEDSSESEESEEETIEEIEESIEESEEESEEEESEEEESEEEEELPPIDIPDELRPKSKPASIFDKVKRKPAKQSDSEYSDSSDDSDSEAEREQRRAAIRAQRLSKGENEMKQAQSEVQKQVEEEPESESEEESVQQESVQESVEQEVEEPAPVEVPKMIGVVKEDDEVEQPKPEPRVQAPAPTPAPVATPKPTTLPPQPVPEPSSNVASHTDDDDDAKKFAWEKPSWAKEGPKLRATGKGSKMKTEGNLAAPVTKIREVVTKEKVELDFQKPQWTGEVASKEPVYQGYKDPAKPITSFPHSEETKKSNLAWTKPDWAAKGPKLRSTKKGEALKSGKEIVRPIGGIKPVE